MDPTPGYWTPAGPRLRPSYLSRDDDDGARRIQFAGRHYYNTMGGCTINRLQYLGLGIFVL
ncbi:hypothetical protein N7493_008348 [Penicillium malachiteum]|uniref:Uncharacterized protein n=1 Tax=Penicillium malachiteum TaxID=1324776 RepID=A0AAD6HGZ1_9EURO|nr:hypothetical protein N7493_008348 [Penicillium malachiteum]